MDPSTLIPLLTMKHIIDTESDVTMKQFNGFCIIFGAYLCWHFATLIPYASEIFSSDGIMGNGEINPFTGKWINPLFINGAPWVVHLMLILGVISSVIFMLSKFRRSSALYLWVLHSCLYTANPLTANPSLGYVGMLLLLCAATPNTLKKIPAWVPRTAWILLASGYTFSGLLKLSSPSWIDGSALMQLMHNPLARPGIVRDLMLHLPENFLSVLTWATLILEIAFLPLAYFKGMRSYLWAAMVLMHLGIMATVDFSDLSLGMLMVHLFTFQRSWIREWKFQLHRIKVSFNKLPKLKAAHCIAWCVVACTFISACSNQSPHRGVFPFSAMEKPPSYRSVQRKIKHTNLTPQKMTKVVHYNAHEPSSPFAHQVAQLQAGDVIAFFMSHQEARIYLKQKKIQKIPYELFSYGHVTLVVPDPNKKLHQQSKTDFKLLQVAMKQPVSASDSLEYLKDKSWIAYRPPAGSINITRLHEFTQESILKCSDPHKSYDFHATLGLGNGNLAPLIVDEIRNQYTCATLIVAALSYSGYELHAMKRNGRLDILTPRQVTDAWGVVRTTFTSIDDKTISID